MIEAIVGPRKSLFHNKDKVSNDAVGGVLCFRGSTGIGRLKLVDLQEITKIEGIAKR